MIKHHDQKQPGEERAPLAHMSNSQVIIYGSGQELKQGRNLEAGAVAAEPMAGCCVWLVSPGLLSLPSYRTQDHQPRGGLTHNVLDPFPSIAN